MTLLSVDYNINNYRYNNDKKDYDKNNSYFNSKNVSFANREDKKSKKELKYRSPSILNIVGGVIVGGIVNKLINQPAQLISSIIVQRMRNISKNLSRDEKLQIDKATIETMKKTGLENKGVSIIKSTSENYSDIFDIMLKEIDNSILKYLPKPLKKSIAASNANQFKFGLNACYTNYSKKIILPEKDLSLSVFHESGHAINDNFTNVGRFLQKSRRLSMLALPLAVIALFKTKKGVNEKNKNFLDKITTFIKENVGKLTFIAFLPILLEEGLATLRGNKFAKEFLNPDLAKKVSKSNAFGFLTYFLTATLSSLGIYLANKVKDSIVKPRIVIENRNK